MEFAVIAVIATLAFLAVLVPLFRKDPHADAREFVAGSGLADAAPYTPGAAPLTSDDDVEREVLRYRAAVRAGTVCGGCGQANPDDARFCYECGRKVPRSDAKEFA